MDNVFICGVGIVGILGSEIARYEEVLNENRYLEFTEYIPEYMKAVMEDPAKYIKNRKALRFYGQDTKMAIIAAYKAVKDSNIPEECLEKDRFDIGLIMGTSYASNVLDDAELLSEYMDELGNMDYITLSSEGVRKLPPLWMLSKLPNTPAGQIAIEHQIRGLTFSISNGMNSSMVAIGEAYQAIKDKRAKFIISGGTDLDYRPECLIDYSYKKMISKKKIPCPFLENADGYHYSEGAGFLVLADSYTKEYYNLQPYAEIIGYYNSYIPSIEARVRSEIIKDMKYCMCEAMKDAKIDKDAIAFVQASAGGFKLLDDCEAEAIEDILGEKVSICTAQSYVGNTRSASGAFSTIFACLELKSKVCGTIGNQSGFSAKHENQTVIMERYRVGQPVYCIINSFSDLGEACCIILKEAWGS